MGFALVEAVVLLLLVPIVDELEVEPDWDASGTLPAAPVEPLGFICAMPSVVAPANASVNKSECFFMDIAPPFVIGTLIRRTCAPPLGEIHVFLTIDLHPK